MVRAKKTVSRDKSQYKVGPHIYPYMEMTINLIRNVHSLNGDRSISDCSRSIKNRLFSFLLPPMRTIRVLSRTVHIQTIGAVHFPPRPSTFTSTRISKKIFQQNKPFQGVSLAKSEEYSSYATNLFFKDSESARAKRFQDRNSMI